MVPMDMGAEFWVQKNDSQTMIELIYQDLLLLGRRKANVAVVKYLLGYQFLKM